MSGSEEKNQHVSPDQGATGETAISVPLAETDMTKVLEAEWLQFLKQEEEMEAHYEEEYMKNIHRRNPELGWDIIIRALFKDLARENRAKRSKEKVFLELDNLEALRTEHLGTSGCLPNWLEKDLEHAGGYVEFENYVTLLQEGRARFGCNNNNNTLFSLCYKLHLSYFIAT